MKPHPPRLSPPPSPPAARRADPVRSVFARWVFAHRCRWGALGAGLLLSPLSGADLVDHSPFAPPDQPPAAGAGAAVPTNAQFLVFKGVYQIGDQWRFNIFNKRENKSAWVTLDDPSAIYQVAGFDQSTNTLKLKLDGREEAIPLEKPDWVSTPVAVNPAPVPLPAGVAAPGGARPGAPGVRPGAPGSSPPRVVPPRRRVIAQQPPGQAGAVGSAGGGVNPSQTPPTLPANLTPPGAPPNFIPSAPPNFIPPPIPPEVQQRMREFDAARAAGQG